jgi:uncharacterized protein (DUF885 family)
MDQHEDAEVGPSRAEGIGATENAELQALLADHWEQSLRWAPEWASILGDHRFDDKLGAIGPEVSRERRERTATWLAVARGIDRASLNEVDRTSLDLFIDVMEARVSVAACRFETWSFSPRMNPLTDLSSLPDLHPLDAVEDGDNLMTRLHQIPALVDGWIANLRLGAESGRYANAESTRRTLKMFDTELAKPVAEWGIGGPLSVELDSAVWKAEQAAAFRREYETALKQEVRPAFERFATLLRETILPSARLGSLAGLTGLPDGDACYAALVKQYTTLDRSPEAVHQTGIEQLESIHAEMRDLGEKLFGERELAVIFERLRSDEALHFDTSEEVREKAESSLARANEKVGDAFSRLPKNDCVVTVIPEHEAPYTTIAYYRWGAPDGSRPGEYFINVYKPETRPRYEAEVLAYHESVPGHHFQISLAQELDGLPAFRRYEGFTVFVEGWALYTERLADELGLYSGDLDRMGMLSFDTWRAARLVVDTGIHHKGWTREAAIAFMAANTPLALNNIDNEVDRYVSWPGQALAYKTGQLEIFALRREAQSALGERFDLPAFHAVILEGGAVTLGVLRRRVEEWVASQE